MPVNYQEAGIITFPSGKRKAVDGKTRDQYSCRLNAEDEAQIAEETQTQFGGFSTEVSKLSVGE
jgi:hypothetical protein